MFPLAQSAPANPSEDTNSWWAGLDPLGIFERFWNLDFSIGGTTIFVHQLVLAILFLVVGAMVSKRLARFVANKVGSVSKVGSNTRQMIERLLYFLLLFAALLVTLAIAGIPMTIFTVFGGAVAIAVGFGAQNLSNNLISGFILMFNRPIRIGDIVEIDDKLVKIEEIGIRTVRCRRTDGADVLVPNSDFLESKVTNWTLFDANIRAQVRVGIAYGSDIRRMREILLESAHQHPKILKHLDPIVLFEDFGDNALIFDLLFWATVSRPMDLRMIQSDLRFEIDDKCKAAGITIAFPQRDVHLDSLSPVEVKVLQ
ncbi:MAG: mechanosensitive ion channel family protein [Opitutales bacterium]